MSAPGGRWRDLGTRVMSAAVMIAVTLAALKGGAAVWSAYVFVIYAVLIWELAPLCDPAVRRGQRLALAGLPLLYPVLGLVAALAGAGAFGPGQNAMPLALSGGAYAGALIGLFAPLLAGLGMLRQGRGLWLGYGAMLAAAAMFLDYAYGQQGIAGLVTLVAIVVISDTAGYFAGRALGGPKFWPAISPKKTWSGTVAGWICAGAFGLVVLPGFGVPLLLAGAAAVLLCFAAQLGDIAESAIKRRAGVKDASALIPGHGGFLDRLDGLVAAASLAGLLTLATGG